MILKSDNVEACLIFLFIFIKRPTDPCEQCVPVKPMVTQSWITVSKCYIGQLPQIKKRLFYDCFGG